MEGSVRKIKRAKGWVWEVRLHLGRDPVSGKRLQPSRTFATKREAEAGKRKWIAEIEAGTPQTPKDLTVGHILTQWLDTEARHRVRPTTFYVYGNTVNHTIIPAIGHIPLAKLTASTLQTWYSRLLDQTDSVDTVRACHERLRQALKMAERFGLVGLPLPTSRVVLPRVERKPHVMWTPEETQRFLDAARTSRYYVAYMLLASAGLRRGELLGLSWDDADLSKGMLHIRHAYTMHGSKPAMGPTKTPESRRHVTLAPTMVLLLKAHQEHQEAEAARLRTQWRASGAVITTVWGSRPHPDTLRCDLMAALKRAEVPHSTIHDFRHLHISTLLAHGASLPEVQRRVGHKRSTITLEVYSHLVGKDRSADVIEGALFSQ